MVSTTEVAFKLAILTINARPKRPLQQPVHRRNMLRPHIAIVHRRSRRHPPVDAILQLAHQPHPGGHLLRISVHERMQNPSRMRRLEHLERARASGQPTASSAFAFHAIHAANELMIAIEHLRLDGATFACARLQISAVLQQLLVHVEDGTTERAFRLADAELAVDAMHPGRNGGGFATIAAAENVPQIAQEFGLFVGGQGFRGRLVEGGRIAGLGASVVVEPGLPVSVGIAPEEGRNCWVFGVVVFFDVFDGLRSARHEAVVLVVAWFLFYAGGRVAGVGILFVVPIARLEVRHLHDARLVHGARFVNRRDATLLIVIIISIIMRGFVRLRFGGALLELLHQIDVLQEVQIDETLGGQRIVFVREAGRHVGEIERHVDVGDVGLEVGRSLIVKRAQLIRVSRRTKPTDKNAVNSASMLLCSEVEIFFFFHGDRPM